MQQFGSLKSEDGSLYPLVNRINLIGRAQQCALILKHPSVSKEHCIIEFDGKGQAILKDLESSNGIYINNQKIAKGSNKPLMEFDLIQFGKDPLRFQYISNMQNTGFGTQDNFKNKQKQSYSKDFKISVTDYISNDNENNQFNNNFPPHQSQQPQQFQASQNFQQQLNNNNNGQNFQQETQQQFNQDLPQHIDINQYNQVKNPQNNNLQQQQSNNKNMNPTETRLLEKIEKMKDNLEQENQTIKQQLLQKEEEILQFKNDNQKENSNQQLLIEENNKLKAKLKALELYCTEQEQKIDRMNDDTLESRKMLEEVFRQDWGKKLHQNEIEINNMRVVLLQKDEEIEYYRKQLASHFTSCKDYNHNFNNHLQFVEEQTRQLSICKKQLQEQENRNNQCQKKWTSLLQENIEKDQKIKGLKMQLDRQIENFQTTFSNLESKINQYNTQIVRSMEGGDQEQYEAAKFLVEQMKTIQEDRKTTAIENENLHIQIQELICEIERIKIDLQHYEGLVLENQNLDVTGTTRASQVVPKMKQRCEELEDLVNDLKQKGGVNKVVDMAELIESLEKQLQTQKNRNSELLQKLRATQNNGVPIKDQNCIDFFSKLLEDKDQKIGFLQKELDQKQNEEVNYKGEIENLNTKLQNGLKSLAPTQQQELQNNNKNNNYQNYQQQYTPYQTQNLNSNNNIDNKPNEEADKAKNQLALRIAELSKQQYNYDQQKPVEETNGKKDYNIDQDIQEYKPTQYYAPERIHRSPFNQIIGNNLA